MSAGVSGELTFFILAVGGFTLGELVQKIKLPDITGQILFGLLLGPTGALLYSSILGRDIAPLVSEESLHTIEFFGEMALGVMVFTIGSHLTRHSLHNAGRRITNLALSHTFVVFSAVTAGLYFIADLDMIPSVLLGAIAIAVAPGTVISVIQKKHARGSFTKTLLGVVAISNVTTIILFDLCHSIAISLLDRTPDTAIATTLLWAIGRPLVTALWGVAVGTLAAKITVHMHRRNELATIVTLFILGNIVLGKLTGFSPILINLIMGITFSNRSYHVKMILEFFNEIEGILYTIFFTLAGTHLDIRALQAAGIAGTVFIVVRIIAQWLNAFAMSRSMKYGTLIGKYLGFAMIPKAGLAIGLLIVLTGESEFTPYIQSITAVVLASVIVNELLGPFAVGFGLDKSGDTNQAQPRLIDFLHEEYILMPIKSTNKWDVIEEMCRFLVKSNNINTLTEEQLIDIVMQREKEFPTAIGEAIAVPHARIPGNHQLMGVIGILQKPMEFEALDQKPVDVVILVATPEGKDALHIKLLATIARIFSSASLHQKIVTSESPAEVYDILQSEEIRTINSYLDEDYQ